MNKDEKNLKIHINIGGFRVPMSIARQDEEIYRNAEKLVLRFMEEYQKIYKERATEEILILVAFRLAVAISKQKLGQDLNPLVEKIKELDKELSEMLSSK